MSKLQDAFFITVITLMLVGTVAINKAQAADLKQNDVKTNAHKPIFAPAYKVRGQTYSPMKSVAHFSQTGKASWYGPGFHGKKTSNGERFNMHDLTAAHRTLPLGTRIRVTNMNNGKSVIVRVNDRGPFHGNRVVDLSKGAANKLGFVQSGMTTVKLETLTDRPKWDNQSDESIKMNQLTPNTVVALSNLFWPLKNFDNEYDARHFMLRTFEQLKQANFNYSVDMIKKNGEYAVRVGPFENLQNLNSVKSQFVNLHLRQL